MKPILSFIFLSCCVLRVHSQKIIGDCTIEYKISDNNHSSANHITSFKTVYIKGKNVKIYLSNSLFNQSTIINYNSGSVVILKEIGNNKYLSKLDTLQWKEQNYRFNAMKLRSESETKTILGYECKKLVAALRDGTSFAIFYTPQIQTSSVENPYQFKDVGGLVLEYESLNQQNNKIRYTAMQINFNPVPLAKFSIPATGYRIL